MFKFYIEYETIKKLYLFIYTNIINNREIVEVTEQLLNKLNKYSNYCKNFTSLKSKKYLNKDTITLQIIISKFQLKIFNLFRIDILKYPTLSSLAFAIYKSKFLKDSNKWIKYIMN